MTDRPGAGRSAGPFPSHTETPVTDTTPPPADIKTDRIVVLAGGVTALFPEMCNFLDPAPAYITLVPIEECEAAKASYPRERHIRVMHDAQVGTVDELTELYRQQLTRAFDALVCEGHIIPTLGEASLRKQTEALRRNNMDLPGVAVPFKMSPRRYAEWSARKQAMGEPKPQLEPYEADVLKQLVAGYGMAVRKADGSKIADYPTDDPAAVQVVIDALTTLKADADARHAARDAQAKAAEDKLADVTLKLEDFEKKVVGRKRLDRYGLFEAMKGFETEHEKAPTSIRLHPVAIADVEVWNMRSGEPVKMVESATLAGMAWKRDESIPPDPGFVLE